MEAKWRLFRVTLKLLSPLHIGWRKAGNLQQTRPYVPARTLWGALTARLTRRYGGFSNYDYVSTGQSIDSNLRFSYFYIVDDPDFIPQCSPCNNEDKGLNDALATNAWPWFTGNKGGFDWKFLDSNVGSPIADRQVAEDGGLHETEFIMPVTRDGKPVYLQGYVFEKIIMDKPVEVLKDWKDELSKIQLGGERSYGWGRVMLSGELYPETNNCFGAEMDLSRDYEPILIIPENGCIFAHVFHNKDFQGWEGRTEILTARITVLNSREKLKFGSSFETPYLCWSPGSQIKKKSGFRILEKGIWRQVSSSAEMVAG